MQLYVSWYIRSFFGFIFLNILYFFKYSCTNISHRRSLYTFYPCKVMEQLWRGSAKRCQAINETLALWIGFRSGFSQCLNYMHFNEKKSVSGDKKTRELMLIPILKRLALYYFTIWPGYLKRNISSMMTKHIVVQRRLHRFAYLIIRIILCY